MECLKSILWVLLLTVVLAAAKPAIEVEEKEPGKKPSSYAFAYETENGQMRDESIEVDTETPESAMEVNIKGSYSFISADGYEYTTYYKADKKGYRPYVTAHKIQPDADKDSAAKAAP